MITQILDDVMLNNYLLPVLEKTFDYYDSNSVQLITMIMYMYFKKSIAGAALRSQGSSDLLHRSFRFKDLPCSKSRKS